MTKQLLCVCCVVPWFVAQSRCCCFSSKKGVAIMVWIVAAWYPPFLMVMISSLAFSRLNKDAFVGMFFWQSWSNDDEKWKSRLRWRVKKCFRWDFWQSCFTHGCVLFLQVVDVVDKRRRRQESGGRVQRLLQARCPTVFQMHAICGAIEEVEVALIMTRAIDLSIVFLWCVLTRVVCFDGSGTESSCFEGREVML